MTALARAEAQTDRNPSLPQIACGNYRKGKYRIHGLVVSIENPRGSIRSAKDGSWRVRMPAAYGYLLGTTGADGQQLDCFLGPHCRSPLVYVIDQKNANTGKWDEHKCLVGFSSPKQVKRIYEASFSDGRAKDRLGALHEMTVAQFRNWLEHGDTTKPIRSIQHRAEGGRVGMADGGVPAFDPSQPFEAAPAPAFDPSQPFEAVSGSPNVFDQFDNQPDQGVLHAIGHGAASGATFGFSDELAGLEAAAPKVAGYDIPELVGPVPTRMIAGAGRLAKQYLTGETEAGSDYVRARDAERQAQREAKAYHPYAYGAGEVAGSIPAMAVLPEGGFIRGAGVGSRLARGAVTGAEYGGLSGAGEGEDLGQRIENTGSGVLGGGAAGFAGAGAGELLNAAGQRFISPMVSTVRGWINPEAEATRRVASALRRDGEMIAAGTAKGLTPQQWIAARNAGEPVTLADLGAGNTQALLRSAANTSPEGRAMLEQVIEDRFLNQGERVASDVRNLVAGGANANKTADQLVAEYDAGRAPLYRKAFSRPDAQSMYDDTLEQVAQAPVVQQAIRMANVTAKNEAAKLGFTPMRESPFAFDETGRMTLRNPDVTPNLQYWDTVKKNLDQLGPDGQAWARTLRDHLDSVVPEYKDARGFAANFFGERDALDAGRTLAGKRVDPQTIKQAMRQMSPQEQDLFREGYASDWANRVIGNMRDTQDVTKAMFNSPNERARAEAVFGPAGMDKIQARMTLETIMDGARKAMGNSTTARQLIEAGLAGGALGGYEAYQTGFDPVKTAEAAGVGAGARLGVGKLLGSEMAAGARRLIGYVDARTARNVAELLTSDDPGRIQRGLGIAMRNQKIMNGLRRTANAISVSALAPSGREAGITAAPAIQRAFGANAAPTTSWGQTVPSFDSSKPFEPAFGLPANPEDGSDERQFPTRRAMKARDRQSLHPET